MHLLADALREAGVVGGGTPTELGERLGVLLGRLAGAAVDDADALLGGDGLEDNPALANVDVMTDVSMAPTAFTRYTVAPTSASRSSRCAAPPLMALFR